MPKCRKCGFVGETKYAMQKHRKTEHPGLKAAKPSSGLDKILDAQKSIKDGITDLEIERELLHKRVLLIDDLVTKYRKLL